MVEVYVGEAESRHPGNVLRSMVWGAKEGLYVGYRLFLKSLRSDHNKSKFSYFWNFFEPLTVAIVFVFLHRYRAIAITDLDIPYAVFVIIGMLIWQTFVDAITIPLGILQRSRNLLTHCKIVPETLVWMVVHQIYFNSFFRVITIMIVVTSYGTISIPGFAAFLVLFSSIILIGLSIGLLLAPINAIYGDVKKFVGISIRPVMFLSAAVFPLPKTGALSKLIYINPIALVITDLRSLITHGVFVNAGGFLTVCIIFGLLFLFSWYVFHLSMKIIAERI